MRRKLLLAIPFILAALLTVTASAPQQTSCRLMPQLSGQDPLGLITTIPRDGGFTTRTPLCRDDASFSFTVTGVQDSTVSFERFESDVRFSYGCPSCSFMVDASAVGAVNDATPGVVFTLKPEGKQLEMACQASQCDVTEPLSESRSETQMLLRGGKRNISPPRRILFTVSRN